jgi:hypothetical protein
VAGPTKAALAEQRAEAAERQRDALMDILNAIVLSQGGGLTVTDEYTFGQPRRQIQVERLPGRMVVRFAPEASQLVLPNRGIARA